MDTPPALWQAARAGRIDEVHALIARGAEVDTSDSNGRTSLCHACIGGHVDVAKLLLMVGADPNRANRDGRTPLHIVCFIGRVPILIDLLVERRADVNRRNGEGRTPLICAAHHGSSKCVPHLLRLGADAYLGWEGRTALEYARQEGHAECEGLLCDAMTAVGGAAGGASAVDGGEGESSEGAIGVANDGEALARGADGVGSPQPAVEAPMGLARAEGAEETRVTVAQADAAAAAVAAAVAAAAAAGDVGAMRQLLGRGASPSTSLSGGRTPLFTACAHGHHECASLLLRASANPNGDSEEHAAGAAGPANAQACTPLHAACASGHVRCIDLLIEAGCDVDRASPAGATPLIGAVLCNQPLCVSRLVAAGACTSLSHRGKNSLQWP